MEKQSTFKFSNEELKKLNYLMPKGYKFVLREEIIKKDVPKAIRKKVIVPPAALPNVPVVTAVITKTRSDKIKEDEYQPKVKIVIPPIIAPVVLPNEPPAGTSPKLLEKIKRHQVFLSLMRVVKVKQSDISLKEIEIKANQSGESYRVYDLQGDIQRFCLMIYKNYAKTSNQYKEAADLENYLANLMKIERNSEVKKVDTSFGLQRSASLQQISNLRKKPQPINRNIYQPLAESKLPTPAEKRILGQMIKKLPSESLQQVCYIVFQSTENRDYIFDLDTLHVKKFRQLQQYVKKYMEKIGEWDQRNYEDEQFSNESIFIIEDDTDQ